jgi:hypothetical protein
MLDNGLGRVILKFSNQNRTSGLRTWPKPNVRLGRAKLSPMTSISFIVQYVSCDACHSPVDLLIVQYNINESKGKLPTLSSK